MAAEREEEVKEAAARLAARAAAASVKVVAATVLPQEDMAVTRAAWAARAVAVEAAVARSAEVVGTRAYNIR
jgi:hypothetical protein